MNIRLEHIVILVLLYFLLTRSSHNEQRLKWIDYRGHHYDVEATRHVH